MPASQDPIGLGPVAPDGTVLLISAKNKAIGAYNCSPSGPSGSPVASYAAPDAGTYTIMSIYGRCVAVYETAAAQVGPCGGTPVYNVKPLDLASGQNYPMGSFSAIPRYNTGSDLFVITGTYFGFQSRTSSACANVLAPSGGRAKRATIPLQIYEQQGTSLFARMRAAATPEPTHLVAWRRPMTDWTRVRGFQAAIQRQVDFTGTVSSASSVTRRGRAYGPLTLTVPEVEIGPSTGTTTLNNQPVSQHVMTVYYSQIFGVASVKSATDVTYIQTGRGDLTSTQNLLQYLDATGAPTGEFVHAETGVWNYSQKTVTLNGNSPVTITVNNILTAPLAGATGSPAVLDLAGNFVRNWTMPPAFAKGTPFKGMIVPLLNDDVLVTDCDDYSTCYASTDLGTTWGQWSGWGPRGSKPQSGVIKPVGQASPNTDLLTSNPLFYT